MRYYKHTNDGRPIFAAKRDAAELVGDTLDQVLRHLRILRPEREFGAMTRGQRFKRTRTA